MANLSLIVLMAVVVLMVSSSPSALAQDIPSCVENLDVCVPFVNSTSSPLPTAECCNPFKVALKNELPCICGFFANPDLLKALNLDLSLVFALPKKCGINTDLKTACASAPGAPSPSSPMTPEAPTKAPATKKKHGSHHGHHSMSPAPAPAPGPSVGSAATKIASIGSVLGSFIVWATLVSY